jgi:hypothetical protein
MLKSTIRLFHDIIEWGKLYWELHIVEGSAQEW